MTRAIPAPLLAKYQLGTTTLCTCFKATLTDGTVIRGTQHDTDIEFPPGSGFVYESSMGYSPSDIVNSLDLSPDNLEISGFLASPAITQSDVRSGRWDYAEIEMFEVDYTDLTLGRHIPRKGTLGEVRADRSKFTTELRGLTQKLSRRVIQITTKECTNDLGDAKCQVDMGPRTMTGSIVDSVIDRRVFMDAARALEVDDLCTGGKCTFVTGLNAGLSMEVRRSQSTGRIELAQAMPFDITAGDQYTITWGCTKRFGEDCLGKFNNGVNFGGFPHLPLADVFKGPSRV